MRPLGDGAVVLARPAGVSARALEDLLRAWPRVHDVVVTEDQACIYFDPSSVPADPSAAIAKLAPGEPEDVRRVTIRARYDGPDLDEVASRARLSPERVADVHASSEYTVAMIGFLPGFAYLRGLDPRLELPRRATPRVRVPALAIGIAAAYTGVYPHPSPGGWNLIGTAVGFEPFSNERGAALRPGDRVRFERIG